MKRTALTHVVYALTVTAGLLAAHQTFAQNAAMPRVDQRQAIQQARIHHGVVHGQISPAEHARLQHQQNHIAAHEATAKADGVITKRERHQLNHLQNRASVTIHRKTHLAHGAPRPHHPHQPQRPA